MKQYATYEANDGKVSCYKCENFIERKLWGDYYYEIGHSNSGGIIQKFGCDKFVSDGWDDVFAFISLCVFEYKKYIKDKFIEDFKEDIGYFLQRDYFMSLLVFVDGCGVSAIQYPPMYDKTIIFRTTSGIKFRKGLYTKQSTQSKCNINDIPLSNLSSHSFPLDWNTPKIDITRIEKIEFEFPEFPEDSPEVKVTGATHYDSQLQTIKYDFMEYGSLRWFILLCGRCFSELKNPFDNIPTLFYKMEFCNSYYWIPYYKVDLSTFDRGIYNMLENFKMSHR